MGPPSGSVFFSIRIVRRSGLLVTFVLPGKLDYDYPSLPAVAWDSPEMVPTEHPLPIAAVGSIPFVFAPCQPRIDLTRS